MMRTSVMDVTRLRIVFCVQYLISDAALVLFLLSLCGHHSLVFQYQSHLCLVIHFPLFHSPGGPHCYFVIPEFLYYLSVSVHQFIASFSRFPGFCLFYCFLVFYPCLYFGLLFGFSCFSLPLPRFGLTTWLLDSL